MDGFKKILRFDLAKAGIPTLIKYYTGAKDIGIAIVDTTSKCNLNCKLCYYKRNRGNRDLSMKEWEKIFQQMFRNGTKFVTWTGGEPLMRKELIEIGRQIFPFNSVFTNGTRAIPDWNDVTFYVSVDGTRKHHNEIRGENYKVIKKNIRNSSQKVNIAMVINNLNEDSLEDFCEEWSRESNCKGIVFDFYTSSRNSKDELSIPEDKVPAIIKRLLRLKEIYEKKILLSNNTIKFFANKHRPNVVAQNCVVRRFNCLDSQGKSKTPCSMQGSDCETCGHFIPRMFYSMFKTIDIEMMNLFFENFVT
jgi:MoaA/NifB/PqqE/SkfB family radical SAM enzyme